MRWEIDRCEYRVLGFCFPYSVLSSSPCLLPRCIKYSRQSCYGGSCKFFPAKYQWTTFKSLRWLDHESSPFHLILKYLKYFEQDWVQTAKRCDKLLKLWMQTSNIDQYCNDNDIVNDYLSHITIILIHYKVKEWTSFYRIGPWSACTHFNCQAVILIIILILGNLHCRISIKALKVNYCVFCPSSSSSSSSLFTSSTSGHNNFLCNGHCRLVSKIFFLHFQCHPLYTMIMILQFRSWQRGCTACNHCWS